MKKRPLSRKKFLSLAGTSTATALGLAGCGDINSIPPEPVPELNLGPDPNPDDNAVFVGADDTGLLNLFYVMAQLEAAFYNQVVAQPYANMPETEERILQDIHQHEIAHRDFYEAFLGENGIQPLHFDFSMVDFGDRNSVLHNALKLEDRSVSIYNGFVPGFQLNDYVAIINKIASVQGRHAAAVRVMQQPFSTYFIDPSIINSNGLDVFINPNIFPRLVSDYLVEGLDISGIPRP